MNTLLLQPTDILFFRDGRPMSGSLAGHGAAWPLPTVLNGALHAALWRADLEKVFGGKVHGHDQIKLRNGTRERTSTDTRKFGSLVTAGPLPVRVENDKGEPIDPIWFFPRPADAQEEGSAFVTLKPAALTGSSSLPDFLNYSVANTRPPTKAKPEAWWSTAAWNDYLCGTSAQAHHRPTDFLNDSDFSDTEHAIGIGIDPDTGTQDGEQFYSAHYLRLREGWRMGAFAEALDKVNGNSAEKRDLIAALFPNSGRETPVIIGGQQRLCTVTRNTTRNVARHSNVESSALPLPPGVTITGTRVKWILLTPAVWPEIGEHKGGWLPSWIRHTDGQVMLKAGDTSRNEKEGREAWRKRVAGFTEIPARLVAALVPKPIPVTGYALPHEATGDSGGAKPTHLAVPAGAVYYFAADNEAAARALAAALNWHGHCGSSVPVENGVPGVPPGEERRQARGPSNDSQAGGMSYTTIRNRRSTLFGEKGFGLGVCGMWDSHPSSTT